MSNKSEDMLDLQVIGAAEMLNEGINLPARCSLEEMIELCEAMNYA